MQFLKENRDVFKSYDPRVRTGPVVDADHLSCRLVIPHLVPAAAVVNFQCPYITLILETVHGCGQVEALAATEIKTATPGLKNQPLPGSDPSSNVMLRGPCTVGKYKGSWALLHL